jgi:hypothetical protein
VLCHECLKTEGRLVPQNAALHTCGYDPSLHGPFMQRNRGGAAAAASAQSRARHHTQDRSRHRRDPSDRQYDRNHDTAERRRPDAAEQH